MLILAGDVGGTKTSLILSEHLDSNVRTIFKHTYPSQNYSDFYCILDDFLHQGTKFNALPKAACIAIAGPVQNGKVTVTNLPWVVSEKKLKERFNINFVKLINDFQAVGFGLASLSNNDLETLQVGQADDEAPKALIGAGTGLGIGIIISGHDDIKILPSEGGRTDFAPRNDLDIELLQFLMHHNKRIACEEILSGKGLVKIYNFLKTKNTAKESAELHDRLKFNDPAAEISTYGLSGKDPLAEIALHYFTQIYGAQAGNIALTILATGGVYIAGGIAPKIINKLKDGTFIDTFNDNPKMHSILKRIPVHVVLNTAVGLNGAQSIAITLAEN
jgi:glucokinase